MADTETTKAMQEALKAAVSRMNNGSHGVNGSPGPKANMIEAFAPLIALLPKLLQNSGAGEEMLKRLDTLQNGDLTSLREQVAVLRRQCSQMLKSQAQILERIHEIQRQQVAAAGAVLDLAQQMARVTLIDEPSADDDDDELESSADLPLDYEMDDRLGRNGNGRRQRRT